MVVYLVPDRFAADDTVLAADRFDAVEVRDPGVAVSAFAYLVADLAGEAVEVWVVVDRPADECGGFATGVLAMGFQSVSYLDYAGCRRCWMGSGLLAGCSV